MPPIASSMLAAFAYPPTKSLGREHPEPDHPFRTVFERDRDRIVHSTAFRRLANKTQVFSSSTNDHHRTRITHTLEVAQISRVVARQLGLEEDLTESIALAHDLGHPPFGHAGEDELRGLMKDNGGFEHNLHALRIVTILEYRYPDFPGLNLSWEVREAFAHHSKTNDNSLSKYRSAGQPFLEAQVADEVDSLAYNAHDIEDALTAGLINEKDVMDIRIWRQTNDEIIRRYPSIPTGTRVPTIVRKLIDTQVNDLILQSRENIRHERIDSIEAVRKCSRLLIGMSAQMRELRLELEHFLLRNVYKHTHVQRMAQKGRRIIRQLFHEFLACPSLLPTRYREKLEILSPHQIICDYLAGMTDRFARLEHGRIFNADDKV